jgi:predicted HAD superfamily Cof-like phosphohydrolase
MSGYTRQVREFTRACHDHLPERPKSLSPEQVAFITRMVNDELEELAEAKTVTEQADALVDAIYYICDSAVRHGMDLDPLFAIVHQANMGKVVNGKVIRREDGKILKPAGWRDPKPLLEAETARQERDGSWS